VGVDGNQIAYNGHSAAYDFKGETLVNLEEREQIQVIHLDYTALEEYRSKFPAWKDADPFTVNS
jgi:predicted amidohydrolase